MGAILGSINCVLDGNIVGMRGSLTRRMMDEDRAEGIEGIIPTDGSSVGSEALTAMDGLPCNGVDECVFSGIL